MAVQCAFPTAYFALALANCKLFIGVLIGGLVLYVFNNYGFIIGAYCLNIDTIVLGGEDFVMGPQ